MRLSCLAVVAAAAALLQTADAVKHADFKTCAQSGFCKRGRAFADRVAAAGPAWVPEYELDADTVALRDGVLTATVWKTVAGQPDRVELPLVLTLLLDGVARVQLDEARRQRGAIELRHGSQVRKQRYGEAENFALVGGANVDLQASIVLAERQQTKVRYGQQQPQQQVLVEHRPFRLTFVRDGEVQAIFNERNFFSVEHWRPQQEKETKKKEDEDAAAKESAEGKAEKGAAEDEAAEKAAEQATEQAAEKGAAEEEPGEDDSTWWDETFGGNTDSKPRGPEAVGLDITFPGYEFVYGIPEHASSLSLKETRGGGEGNYNEPYRLYNADVFEYDLDSPMTLYGSIPFMQAQKNGSTVGVFWLNAAETWVDIVKSSRNPGSLSTEPRSTRTHWISESGLLDVFFLPGPTAGALYGQYAGLTGPSALPPLFALGYHQCRWNYVSQDDVKDVDRNFDRFDIPYDVIWLDIEYTDGKKYFTWDPLNFGDPLSMQDQLQRRQRRLVAIIDPHIKQEAGYNISAQLVDRGLAVGDNQTAGQQPQPYTGWCWPGSSNWIDAFNPAAVEWWKGLFGLDVFPASTEHMHIWNDMNEPSVFSGPETTMPKDNVHHGGWEHRDLHNLNGLTFHRATYEGLLARLGPHRAQQRRPFVLTRSFFAGSQRSAATWTGDNQASWPHLAAAFPMLLSLGVAGMPFAGADVGGFFGNPAPELFARWYQAGAFYPFFRAHAHIDAKRREPYLAAEPYRSVVRAAVRLRYALLPVWYTAMHRASTDGLPVLRPHFVEFPHDRDGFGLDDQFFVGGSGLLAKPVVHEGVTEVRIYLPDDEPYYDYASYRVYHGKGHHAVPAPLDTVPLLMRGGHVVPRKDRHRRSSGLMQHDPYTLVVSLDNKGQARGELFVDDGESFAYQMGGYIRRSFVFDGQSLASRDLFDGVPDGAERAKFVASMAQTRVEKVILVGVGDEWAGRNRAQLRTPKDQWPVDIGFIRGGGADGIANVAVIRDPRAPLAEDWVIEF